MNWKTKLERDKQPKMTTKYVVKLVPKGDHYNEVRYTLKSEEEWLELYAKFVEGLLDKRMVEIIDNEATTIFDMTAYAYVSRYKVQVQE